MKKILFLLLCTVSIYGQTSTGQEQSFPYGIVNESLQTITTPTYIGTFGTDGTQGKIPSALIATTEQLELIKNQINPNSYVVTDNGSSLVINDFTLNAGWNWTIAGIEYTNPSPVNITIPLASSGYQRIDLIVLTESNTAIRVAGVQSAGTAISPTVPLNTIAIASVFSDSTVHTQVIPKPRYPVSQSLRDGMELYSPSENVVVDALALKSDINSPTFTGVATAPTAAPGTNDLTIANAAFVTGGLATKENAFSKNTAFNKNFGTTAGTVLEGGTLGSNAYTSTAYLPLSGGTLNDNLYITGALKGITFDNPIGQSSGITQSSSGSPVWNINKGAGDSSENYNVYNFTRDKIDFSLKNNTGEATFSSTVKALPATLSNELVTKGQLDASVTSKPYKVYTALLSQTGTSAPTATVLENTLGGTIVWTRSNIGQYVGTLTGAFIDQKTIIFVNRSNPSATAFDTNMAANVININTVGYTTFSNSAYVDGQTNSASIEIRVYN